MTVSLPRLTLVLGGARSGKSRYAEQFIGGAAKSATYLATAQALDGEMVERIRRHREGRTAAPGGIMWHTVEEPLDLAGRLAETARPDCPILVDCLTLWLSNLMLADADVAAASAGLIATLLKLAGPVVLGANEVGLGIVPDNALARAFRDHAGQLNQAVAAIADRVVFLAAGLPMVLKDVPPTTNGLPPTLTLPREGGGNHSSFVPSSSPSPPAGEGRGGGYGSSGAE
ncbi:MAG: bifunctional adenosylcobinamide kinase/adenosylcobinamide-phosphate guanylyltransferase [Alphaproteobacteria bacterium]|nr:bifunctional adenosylcobinamide kinase/adenosylcobinamide-phosphate guanylyltransferase [Alphaproteobacteria bacterium]